MNDEWALRVVLTAVMLSILPFGIYHRMRSQSGERLDRRQEGAFVLATLRPIGAVFWFSMFAWMVNPAWLAWSSLPLPIWLRWIGVPTLLCGSASACMDLSNARDESDRHRGHARRNIPS